jgi:NTE family protein
MVANEEDPLTEVAAPDSTSPSSITIDRGTPNGYRRPEELQQRFEAAAQTLLERDGWPNPQNGDRHELVADLALEGGGVKGIGLVGAVLVLSEAGYRFRGVAGTSAGAIAASLIAAISKSGQEMSELKTCMDSMEFSKFMPEGKLHSFLDQHGGKAGALLANAAILADQIGLYSGDYLEEWLTPHLQSFGVSTFGDLKLSMKEDPGMSVADGHDNRLVVHTSDITRSELVRLPWDYPIYGYGPDDQEVVMAVRASMSIPFFFVPVTFEARAADVQVPTPDGGTITLHHDAGTVTWVDGGMLRNFPIGAFDRVDDKPPRWPTIGIKLSSLQTDFPATSSCESAIAVGVHCLRTMMNEWDAYAVDAATAGRTIFVNNSGLTATQFDLTPAQQDMLFLNGVSAATQFVIEMAQAGGVPRSADDARQRITKAT